MKKLLYLFLFVLASQSMSAQDLETIREAKPFKISGAVGASANYFNSNEAIATRPPWMYNLYGNFSPQVYGISMPVSFVLNQYGNSFTQPFAQFGISPTYKWATLHLGYRNIRMNPLVFEGQSFRGAGVELNPGLFRFAAFYGKLNKRVNEDTTSGRYTIPQYSRTGYGVKVGVGNADHFADLTYFYAKDDTSSATVITKGRAQSQENAVVGLSVKTTLMKKILVTADVAASGLTEDLTAPEPDSVSYAFPASVFSKLMPFNNSTRVQFGGQAAVTANLKNYNTTVGFRRVDPGFKSLGTPYMLNDIVLYNWMNNLTLLTGKLMINTNLSNQHNNLQKDLATGMNTFVSSLNLSGMPSTKVSISGNYSGYILRQTDGTMETNDSIRLHQQIHQFGLMPSYTLYNTLYSHTVSSALNYMVMTDKNPVTAPFTNSDNLSASLSYNFGLVKKGINFSLTGIFNQYAQDTNRYTTYGANLGTSGQFLKKKNLNAQITAGYMMNESTIGNAQSNLTFSGNVGYRYQKHSFTLHANYVYTPYNPINEAIEKAITGAVASKHFMSGIAYNYTF